jgi:hypothetical protein
MWIGKRIFTTEDTEDAEERKELNLKEQNFRFEISIFNLRFEIDDFSFLFSIPLCPLWLIPDLL